MLLIEVDSATAAPCNARPGQLTATWYTPLCEQQVPRISPAGWCREKMRQCRLSGRWVVPLTAPSHCPNHQLAAPNPFASPMRTEMLPNTTYHNGYTRRSGTARRWVDASQPARCWAGWLRESLSLSPSFGVVRHAVCYARPQVRIRFPVVPSRTVVPWSWAGQDLAGWASEPFHPSDTIDETDERGVYTPRRRAVVSSIVETRQRARSSSHDSTRKQQPHVSHVSPQSCRTPVPAVVG